METRRFGEQIPAEPTWVDQPSEAASLLRWMRQDEIGSDAVLDSAFGQRRIVYCDYTASARASDSIEEYIREEVLPFYGNTHSSVTVTAEQTTLFLHEARQNLRAATGAGDTDDVIFVGAGATAAVELLTHLLCTGLEGPLVVVHSAQEHHSNLLPWRQHAVKCFVVEDDVHGVLDFESLEEVLKSVRQEFGQTLVVGAFNACSNLTGILTDVERVTSVLKKFSALAVWDYASAAPYTSIQVNGQNPIDALFFSGHKFPGGVSSPGVLVIKKELINAKVPKRIGGGTVFFVNDEGVRYLKEAEHREEGGTADSVGAVRLAMAVKLKRTIGESRIAELEASISRLVLEAFSSCEQIVLLGPAAVENRLPVFSFLVKDVSGLFFHHNYISALLNDLFGIQTRSGCMCAGPYAHRLLGISQQTSSDVLEAIRETSELDRTHLRRTGEYSQHEFLRPGFTRLSIAYFFSLEEVKTIVDCVCFVARHAADFIHLYQVNCESSEWHHNSQRVFHNRRWLGRIQFTDKGLVKKNLGKTIGPIPTLSEALGLARELAAEASKFSDVAKVPDGRIAIDSRFAHLRYFVLPIEVVERRVGHVVSFHSPPFSPKAFSLPPAKPRVLGPNLVESQSDTGLGNGSLKQSGESRNDAEHDEQGKSEEETICPLNPEMEPRGRGIDDIDCDEKLEKEVKEAEDWGRRVVVTSRQLTAEEERRLAWHTPPLEMYKKVADVIHELKMIREGDKVLVCLSGGKDSLSLLHILHFYQMRCRKNRSTNFSLGAITIDPGSAEYNPRPMIDYARSLNIDYFYEEQDIIGAAKKVKGLRSICAFCSRMKRGRLAAAAAYHGWNVLAMGQHLDDLAESFFIAAFQNGNLSTMKAHDEQLRVIRPLVFVREKALRQFAADKKLPVVAENCPACFNQATERHRVKQMLAQQELIFPDLFNSLRSALRPLLLMLVQTGRRAADLQVDSAHTSEMRTQAIENIVFQK